MKVLIGNSVIENVSSESNQNEIIAEITVDNAVAIHNEIKNYQVTTLKFTNDNIISGIYSDKVYKKYEYEDGHARFIFVDADKLAMQVEQNKANIEYICLMQDI